MRQSGGNGKVPATVITGFLGAGKTSLIRNLLRRGADGRRIALVINEFGDVGVDRELLLGCGDAACVGEGDIVELANGCLCCTVADDFVPTMEALLGRDPRPEHIVIETSGLALPKPLVRAFNWPEIRTRLTVDGVVAVVDGPAVAAGRFAADPEAVAAQRAADESLDHESPLEELFEEQLACADLVVLNKADLLDADALARVRAEVAAELRPGVKLVAARGADLPAAVLLGLAAAAEDDLGSRPSHHDGMDGAHDHDDFASFVLAVPPLADPAAFEARLRAAIAAQDVLRVKGFLAVEGRSLRLALQAVGARIERHFDRPWLPDEPRQGRLVVIGHAGLDRDAVAAAVLPGH